MKRRKNNNAYTPLLRPECEHASRQFLPREAPVRMFCFTVAALYLFIIVGMVGVRNSAQGSLTRRGCPAHAGVQDAEGDRDRSNGVTTLVFLQLSMTYARLAC